MIDAFLPSSKAFRAETASAVDVDRDGLPILHKRGHLTVVHQSKMLAQVIFSIKCAGVQSFFLTLTIIVAFNVIIAGVLFVAPDASLVTSRRISYHRPRDATLV